MISLIGAVALCLAQTPAAPETTPAGPAFTSKLRTLVVFKEGFGFYIREGAATLENGWATTNLVPQAAAGTFWVYPKNANDRVDTIVLTHDNLIDFDKPEELKSSLANKVGSQLAIVTDTGEVGGKLTNLLDKMLLLQDPKSNFVAVEYSKIKSVSLVDYPVQIKMRTTKPNGLCDLGIAYIQDGVRWAPTYTLELNGETARLTLRGTLLNLDETLKDANLVFVVGAPTLVNRGTIDDLLQGFVSGPMGGAGGGFGGGQSATFGVEAGRAVNNNNRETVSSGDLASNVVSSDETGELQYYTKPHFSLRPGEKAMTMIFEAEIPVHPLFDWDADSTAVQYILTLENKSDQPFTTGPVFVIDGQRPVGQQTIPLHPSRKQDRAAPRSGYWDKGQPIGIGA